MSVLSIYTVICRLLYNPSIDESDRLYSTKYYESLESIPQHAICQQTNKSQFCSVFSRFKFSFLSSVENVTFEHEREKANGSPINELARLSPDVVDVDDDRDLRRKLLVAVRLGNGERERKMTTRTFFLLGRDRGRGRGHSRRRRRRRHRHRDRSRRRGRRCRRRRRGDRRRRRRWRWWLLLLVTCHRFDGHRAVDRVGLRRSAEGRMGRPARTPAFRPLRFAIFPEMRDLYLCLSYTIHERWHVTHPHTQ